MLDQPQSAHSIQMATRFFTCFASAALALLAPGQSPAWGPLGHATIGNAAVRQLDPAAHAALTDILAPESADQLSEAVVEACFWPDTIRDTPEWSWSAPLHYVNIPRSSDRYDRARDCPDGRCVTEGVLKYAVELGRPGVDRVRRWQAFAWLCHLVADLHQPLHAGFRDDRGGNRVDIEYQGERTNLHRFWDSALAMERLTDEPGRAEAVERAAAQRLEQPWNPADVASWTTESHRLASTRAYPPEPIIDADFADASWRIVQQQWRRAAGRLAVLLNEVLPVESERPGQAD